MTLFEHAEQKVKLSHCQQKVLDYLKDNQWQSSVMIARECGLGNARDFTRPLISKGYNIKHENKKINGRSVSGWRLLPF